MRLRGWMIALIALLGPRRRRDREPERERIVAAGAPDPRAELVVIALLLLAALCAAGFVVAYALDASTQLLGGTLAGAFGLIAAALIVTGRRLVVAEELPGEYPQPDRDEAERVGQIVTESGSRLTRKRLLAAAGATAGGALGAAIVAPAASLGPLLDSGPLYASPWRRDRRLVDDRGHPMRADAIEPDTFYTAYPQGAPRDDLGAPLVLVRLDPAALELPAGRRDWAPEGILAFSKICTHAGCAIALYRTPLFAPVQPRPALVCPCHYSTFDPATGGTVLFGPAGRALPQLPLMIDGERELRAAGNYSGAVGPSWSGVRSNPPT